MVAMQLPKVYEPGEYESDIYALWEKSGSFAPSKGKDTYTILMPPPNANGNLHIGHALTNALQDIAVRYHRMKGDSTLYLPGADHAGFETQVVYEKELTKQGKSRFDFNRDELYSQVWDFVALNRSNFENQIRALGASVDWSRYTFTLDDQIVQRAYQTFKKMWDEKLIYRGERLVNFCTVHGTAFADIEVTYKDVPGHLWHITYPLTDGSGSITVATTRPETMLGDTAVAVHPQDDRYKQFVGKTVRLPLTSREIPVIADDMVDKDFGSGAVKITPAHDPNDFEVAQRHDLPMITVIDHEGNISHEAPGVYRGHAVDSVRQLIVDDLKELGLLEKEEAYSHSVGHCYKCGSVIQPLLREQWFVDMQPLATAAIKALHADEITFYPAAKKDQLIAYLKGLRDWNISRQIAWGIPIPAFQNIDDPDDWIYDERVGEETITVGKKTYRRDPDVFDTWFSSSSWPYATLDYPNGEDFKQFYPVSLMETGGEILYPWVSRMIMLGLYVTGKVPFEAVYIHGYVMAEDGAKMSKSLGNVINPLDVINQYGSDALRMGIVAGRAPAVNRGYDSRKVIDARNFCNKLWNIARYIEDKLGEDYLGQGTPKSETVADDWMLSKLQHITDRIGQDLDNYRFSEAYDSLYHFVWDDFADWYIEASKIYLNKGVLAHGLETILKLAHPFAPFVTETIWQTFDKQKDSLLITSSWPKTSGGSTKGAETFEDIKTMVSEIRLITASTGVSRPRLYHTGDAFIAEHSEMIKKLAGLADTTEVKDGYGLHLTQTAHTCWLDLDQETIRRFVTKLQEAVQATEKSITQLEGRLSNKAYVDKAPKALVEETKSQLAEAKELLAKQQSEFDRFKR